MTFQSKLLCNQQVVCKLVDTLPVYHTRAEVHEPLGHFMSGTKAFMIRSIYCESIKDASASRTSDGLNFLPKNPHTKIAQHYKGRLYVKPVDQK